MSQLAQRVRTALQSVADPATSASIVTSGQLREIRDEGGTLVLEVDLISPGYPLRETLEGAIRSAIDTARAGEPELPETLELRWGLAVPRKPPRQDLARIPGVKNVIAVAAGKGGVGKSTVSVNTAMALHRLGAAVGLLDADIYGPSVPKMLGRPDRPSQAVPGADAISPAHYRGLAVMSVDYFVEPQSAVIWRGPMIHKLLTKFLEDVKWGELDYLIVDLPPGTGDAQLTLCQLIPITGSIIVTTPQEVALLDVRRAINMFAKLEVPILGVAENMSYYQCPACGHTAEMFGAGGGQRLADEFNVELLARIPLDPKVAAGGETGAPLVESAPASDHARIFSELAAAAAMRASVRSATGPKRSSLLRTVD